MITKTDGALASNRPASHDRYFIRSVQRANDVLLLFLKSDNELSAAEISRQLDLPRSTTFRLLVTLPNKNLVDQNPLNGNYRLGVSCLALGNAFLTKYDLRQRALKSDGTQGDDLRLELRRERTPLSWLSLLNLDILSGAIPHILDVRQIGSSPATD